MSHAGLADTLGRSGRLPEAVAHIEKALELGGRFIAILGVAGAYYGANGDYDEARAILAELQDYASPGPTPDTQLALVYAGLGDTDEAFAHLQRAVENRDCNLLYTIAIPRTLGLREDPRFAGLLRSIGLSHLTAFL
jgi:tetratricopeptide (TPR) repeat protein